MRKSLAAAFPRTIPVLMGYLFLGAAFGILMTQNGFSPWWALVMSLLVYAGSMQFVLITLMTGGANLIEVALTTLMVNFRHVFYGLSFLDKYNDTGWKKPYLIFSLTDETYSLLCGVEQAPEGIDRGNYYLSVSALNHFYWTAGSVLGAVFGTLISFNSTGIDFSMTALFTVTCVEQWISSPEHRPALVGLGAAVAGLLIFGAGNMVIPAMLVIVAVLLALRTPLEQAEEKRSGKEQHK